MPSRGARGGMVLLKREELLGAPGQREDTRGHLHTCTPPQHTHCVSKDNNWKTQARCKQLFWRLELAGPLQVCGPKEGIC